ncbi:MAG TPA: hypothetical protein VFT06_10430 [Flavisolibacter sp.]|nr:hypothetical protein [Flavisolibacter sp.]
MKNILVMTAFLVGFSICANAQSTQQKPAAKPTGQKSQKKTAAVKQTAELKNTGTYNANAPLLLTMPALGVDTTSLPAVKND